MTNAAPANAAALPESSRRQSRDMKTREAFERAHARWLSARAAIQNPDLPEDNESADARAEEEWQAERDLIFAPVTLPWMVWTKLELFERTLTMEFMDGRRSDSFAMLAFGAIKADIIRLDLCGPAA